MMYICMVVDGSEDFLLDILYMYGWVGWGFGTRYVVLGVLTPLSDCRQESVEKIERRILGVSYLYCIYTTGFCVVGFCVLG